MYDSINGGLVSNSEMVFGGINCKFGRNNSLDMSRNFSYIASGKSGYAIAGIRWSAFNNHPGLKVKWTRPATRLGNATSGSIACINFERAFAISKREICGSGALI